MAMQIFIIIPCFNEQETIAQVVNSVKDFGRVVVIDDGSTDQSFRRAKAAGVKVLRHLINRGQGAALETGNRWALKNGAEIAIHFDSDGQHQAGEIPKLIEPIVKGEAEIVFGSRFLNKNHNMPWLKKWLILKPAVKFQNFLLGTNLSDAHNGFRALSRAALKKIRLTQDGMAHASEIVEQAVKAELPYVEIPVNIIYNDFGQGWLSGLKILKDLIFGKLNK
jgi:glycosyltransferase involved in cell wall biosynthesis